MASDAPDDSHKHRRSPSDDGDAENSSKRHKHRHHKHHHHHHHKHRHGSSKSDAPPLDDVEEGEILDDDGNNAIPDDNTESDLPNLGSDHLNGSATPGKDAKRVHSKDKSDEKVSGSEVNANGCLNYESHDPNDERTGYHGGHRILSSDKDKDKDKVHGRSYSRGSIEDESSKRRRYIPEESYDDRGHGRDCEGRDREIDRDRIREDRARGLSRDREIDRYPRREWEHSVDREIDRGRRRDDRERELSRDRDSDRGRRRDDRERELSRDRDSNRNRRRDDREQELSRDRDIDRNRRRDDKEREQSRDRDQRRDRERYMSKEREVDKDRKRDNERGKDRDRERERYSDRALERMPEKRDDRSRDKGREKYEYLEDIRYNDQDRHRQSRNMNHDDKNYSKDERERANPQPPQSSEVNSSFAKRDEEGEDEDYDDTAMLQLPEQEEEDLNRIKEESRRRRQAILEKYKNKQLQQPTTIEPHLNNSEKDKEPSVDLGPQTVASNPHQLVLEQKTDGVDIFVTEPSFSVGKSPPLDGVAQTGGTAGGGLGEGTPKSERPDGVFCDDIFGETPTGIRKSGKEDGLPLERTDLHDNWDDAEGYYSYRFGELLDGRYEITAAHGKGVFSTVVRARNIKPTNGEPEEVAIKIIRSNDTMYKAGMSELVILKKLAAHDPENKRHCVLFLSNFKYRNHLCLVFESLNMNLREVLKKFGRNIGLKLTAVRVYAKQLFIALKHLRNCGVLHCDIKPDNMLVNEAKNVLKLCDFGNAMFAGKNEITPYLVSRFYRAPEIILGLTYDYPMDIWSVGCCLYELYTGKVLFPGATNNDMLRLHMELKGSFPKKMLRKGAFTNQNFDQDLNFHAIEEDPVTKKTIKRIMVNIKPKDIGSVIVGSSGEDPKMLADFKDLLDKMFVLDPDKRLTVSQALSHPFITGK